MSLIHFGFGVLEPGSFWGRGVALEFYLSEEYLIFNNHQSLFNIMYFNQEFCYFKTYLLEIIFELQKTFSHKSSSLGQMQQLPWGGCGSTRQSIDYMFLTIFKVTQLYWPLFDPLNLPPFLASYVYRACIAKLIINIIYYPYLNTIATEKNS